MSRIQVEVRRVFSHFLHEVVLLYLVVKPVPDVLLGRGWRVFDIGRSRFWLLNLGRLLRLHRSGNQPTRLARPLPRHLLLIFGHGMVLGDDLAQVNFDVLVSLRRNWPLFLIGQVPSRRFRLLNVWHKSAFLIEVELAHLHVVNFLLFRLAVEVVEPVILQRRAPVIGVKGDVLLLLGLLLAHLVQDLQLVHL